MPGRIGQLLNISSLANDCGIPMRTVQEWLSSLQASYIIFLLQPYYKNFSKRLVKTPKLYFYDSGLACSLLGIESAQQLQTHYLRGNLVEGAIIADMFKHYYNKARTSHIYFWRDNRGHEIDCIIEQGTQTLPIEIKAGKTVNNDYFSGLSFWHELTQAPEPDGFVIYAGTQGQRRRAGIVVPWSNISTVFPS